MSSLAFTAVQTGSSPEQIFQSFSLCSILASELWFKHLLASGNLSKNLQSPPGHLEYTGPHTQTWFFTKFSLLGKSVDTTDSVCVTRWVSCKTPYPHGTHREAFHPNGSVNCSQEDKQKEKHLYSAIVPHSVIGFPSWAEKPSWPSLVTLLVQFPLGRLSNRLPE